MHHDIYIAWVNWLTYMHAKSLSKCRRNYLRVKELYNAFKATEKNKH